ncbi:MAG TPA: chemotaxis protein CheW [Terriglobales bacterium]|nr:chemotaxis protein CheW [Terriglobales bacterium]
MKDAAVTAFVLFPLGEKRFAFPADQVSELARADQLQDFPHTSPWLTGVLVRRGNVVPVCDIAQVLVPGTTAPRRFYLIAKRRFGSTEEDTGIPVSGDCELAVTEMLPVTGKLPNYAAGVLSLESEIVEVIDLEKLLSSDAATTAEVER